MRVLWLVQVNGYRREASNRVLGTGVKFVPGSVGLWIVAPTIRAALRVAPSEAKRHGIHDGEVLSIENRGTIDREVSR